MQKSVVFCILAGKKRNHLLPKLFELHPLLPELVVDGLFLEPLHVLLVVALLLLELVGHGHDHVVLVHVVVEQLQHFHFGLGGLGFVLATLGLFEPAAMLGEDALPLLGPDLVGELFPLFVALVQVLAHGYIL